MSTLGDEVQKDLDARGLHLTVADIDKMLSDAGVSPIASKGVPVRLRVRRVQVLGTRTYRDPSASSTATGSAAMVSNPINLDWTPTDGVNGVGHAATP